MCVYVCVCVCVSRVAAWSLVAGAMGPCADPHAAAAPHAPACAQVYKGKLKTGEVVAVKVQRPYVLETVTVDLYIIRSIGLGVSADEEGGEAAWLE
jgi:hypothetical protein